MNGNNTDSGNKSTITAREINLPKGGGAISGMGDTFKPDFFSGTSSYSIPIPTPGARDLTPALSLTYNSGNGSDVFGLGFSLNLPKISIETSKGIPRYDGTDIYILAGAGELVKKMQSPAKKTNAAEDEDYSVTLYQPRIETLFSKIEYWVNKKTKDSYWKIISTNNIISYYGRTPGSRIANPFDNTQIFEWLIDETIDPRGNRVIYGYKAENNESVPKTIYEINRSVTANRYLQKVQYGNYNIAGKEEPLFAFELLFDYGEYNLTDPANAHTPSKPWDCRPDPFSSYNSGFEIRTFRLCKHVLLFHHFVQEQQEPLLARTLAFKYSNHLPETNGNWLAPSLLISAESTGYKKMPDNSFLHQSLPKVDLKYSGFNPPETPVFRTMKMGENSIPGYLDNSRFLAVDLYGEGLPGFLYSNSDSTFFLEPKGQGEYSLPEHQPLFPINKDLQGAAASIADIDGNGQLELVVNDANNPGYYQLNEKGSWENFRAFEKNPTDISNPKLEYADIDANGKLDILLPGIDDLLIYYSDGKKGFQPAKRVENDNEFPLVKQNFAPELVTFATIFGDGLSHRVRVTNGSVECWPCLGYGRFGKKITLANAPSFAGDFDQQRLFFIDADGSGTADIAYVYPDRVELFLNQSGNSFSNPIRVNLPALYGQLDQINFADILGNGTSSLVFSKMAPAPVHYYFNFAGEIKTTEANEIPALKPFLLTEIDNNCGTVTQINYCSSTKFLLEDKKAGRPWLTKLRFPVQVVEQIKVMDKISASVFVNKFKYHDGYYDPVEKEFCGFGFVESWDTETYEEYAASTQNPEFPVKRINKELYVPPVYTRMWYNTGSFENNPVFSNQYKRYYFNGDKNAYDFPASLFQFSIWNSDAETLRQACFALKGQIMRTEVYADDGTLPLVPYTVAESNNEVIMLQPIGQNEYAIFMTVARESISYNYDRNADDPAVTQNFTLETDLLCGLAQKTVCVYLSRRPVAPADLPIYPEQYLAKATIECNNYINVDDNESGYWRGVAYEEMTFQLHKPEIKGKAYFSFIEIEKQTGSALKDIIPYEEELTPGKTEARQLSWTRLFYWNSLQKKCSDYLPLGRISPSGLLHHQETACFTKKWITKSFANKLADKVIENDGGYCYNEGYWWNRGLVQFYLTKDAFCLPWKTENCFVDNTSPVYTKSEIEYDQPYNLFPVKSTAYLSSTSSLTESFTMDYQALGYKQGIDVNNNVQQFLFDPLGLVIASTIFGLEKNMQTGGMRIYDYEGQPAEYKYRTETKDKKPITFADINANREYYLQGATSYFFYNIHAWSQGKPLAQQQPVCSITLDRQNYFRSAQAPGEFSCQVSIEYFDGVGRSLETKLWAGVMPVQGKSKAKSSGTSTRQKKEIATAEYWLVSGRTVYNNKGNPCEQYLPFYDNTPDYESQKYLEDDKNIAPPSVIHYDPLQRVTRIDTPKGFFSKEIYTPWQVETFDENDTVLGSDFYINFIAHYPKSPPERTQAQIDEMDALEKAARFSNTPVVNVMDNMGFTIRIIETVDNRTLVSKQVNDIQGRTLELTDARLNLSNESKGTAYYNFRYRYMMGDSDPFYTDSADAGTQLHFSNIYDSQLWSYSARDYCQFIQYDNLQRQTALYVKKMETAVPVIPPADFNLVEKFTYGDSLTDPKKYAGANLRGQLYQVSDLSGITTNTYYSLTGQVLVSQKQLLSEYKKAMNWKNETGRSTTDAHVFGYTYNALDLLLTESKPGETVIYHSYNPLGLPTKTWLSFKDKTTQRIVDSVEYYPNLQKKFIVYGNNNTSNYTYEETTQRLIRVLSNREGAAAPLQDINYTYDPVGNITRSWDYSFKTVFNNNQKIDPLSDYSYDAIYRLTNASGRQHPGINGRTYRNNKSDNSFKQSRFNLLTPANDGERLENYTESYFYDDSNNLIKKQHTAKSASYSTLNPVLENSNRLKSIELTPDASTPVEYDRSGNQRNLFINSSIPLYFNCCENLVKTDIITRPAAPEETNDAEYYLYDNTDIRTCKVTERYTQGGTMTEVTKKIYYDNFEIKQNSRITASGKSTTNLERYTVRVMIGDTCAAIVHQWVTDDLQREVEKPGEKSIRFQMGNNLGSVSLEMDEHAKLISYEEYFPYGGTAIVAGSNQVEVASKDYRYSGKECDDSTGLYYYGARYYVSWLGRWLNPDPAGTVDGMNLYAFVGNNPVKMIDPDGQMKRVREDTDALVESVRYLSSSELQVSLDLANRVFAEAYAAPALFIDESARFTPALEKDLIDFFNQFSGSFAASNPTLYSSLKDAGGYEDEQAGDQRERYKSIRTKSNKTLSKDFPGIDFKASAKATKNTYELHHLSYKAKDPKNAATVGNLVMATRGSSRSGYIGTHEGLYHLITSGNDSKIFKQSIAAVTGLIKRMIDSKIGGSRKFFNLRKGNPASAPSEAPTKTARSKSMRILLLSAKKREAAGGTTGFFQFNSGYVPQPMEATYYF